MEPIGFLRSCQVQLIAIISERQIEEQVCERDELSEIISI